MADTEHHKSKRRRYPTQAAIDRVIRAARKAGIFVNGIEVSPDGVIRVIDRTESPQDDFERWQRSKAFTSSADV